MRSDIPQWAGRVSPNSVRRLYASEAKGIRDDSLIDDVGYAILARCESILMATEAHQRRKAACPLCGQVIRHNWKDDFLLHCKDCKWELSWGAYRKSYRKKQLHAGGMEPFIRAFVSDFTKASSSQEKMILIDTLLHRYHGEYEGAQGRPGATNLIALRGQKAIVALLDEIGGRIPAPEQAKRWVEKVRLEESPPWQIQ